LDYHYDHSPRDVQQHVFAQQIELAHEHDLPLVIHTRDAWEDTFALLDAHGVPPRTVFHCFTGGPTEATEVLARNAVLSISGIVSFGGAEDLRAAVAATPLESLMVETDSPYLAPVPHRGKRNRPAFVTHVGEVIAELHGCTADEVAAATTRNALDFYGISLPRDTELPGQ
ncbi:MAG: TatD family hydrolase, partial [Microthrixaceae bacterium]